MSAELRDFLDAAAAGPWFPEPDLDGDGLHRRRDTIWLTNDGGDSLQVDEDDAAVLINSALTTHVPTPDELDLLLSDISAAGYASEARETVENWTRKWWGVESAFTTKWNRP